MSGSADETGVDAESFVDGGRIDARALVGLILSTTVFAYFGGLMGWLDTIYAGFADLYVIPIDGMVDAGVAAFSGQAAALEAAWETAGKSVIALDLGPLAFAVGVVVTLAFFWVVSQFANRFIQPVAQFTNSVLTLVASLARRVVGAATHRAMKAVSRFARRIKERI